MKIVLYALKALSTWLLAVSILPTVTPAFAAPTTFAPTADAFVSSAAKNSNFGSSFSVEVENGRQARVAYLRFDLAGLRGPLNSATLRLRADTSDTCSSGPGVEVYRGATSAWAEDSVTWRNQPGSTGSPLSAADGYASGTTIALNVAAGISTVQGSVTFVLRMPKCASALNRFGSRESANKPQLVVDAGDTVAPTVTITDPPDGATVGPNPTASGTAQDNLAVTGVEIALDGGAWNPASCTGCGSSSASWSIGLTALGVGPHAISARAIDPAGNVSDVATRNFSVADASPPPPPSGCDGVHLYPDSELGQAINGTTDTTFCIHGGTYDLGISSLRPGSGDKLIGDEVTISGLGEIAAPTKIISRGPNGVIDFTSPATNVLIENLDISGGTGDASCKPMCGRGINGHSGNVSNLTVRKTRVHDNASNGIGGAERSLLVNVELDHNGATAFLGCCSGGVKSVHPYTIRDSYIHHNIGNGVWQDICGTEFVVIYNTITYNTRSGVRYEHNQDCPGNATIQYNTIQNNNTEGRSTDAAGVAVNSAPNAEIAFNIFGANGLAVSVAGGRGPYTGTFIHDNALNGDTISSCTLSGVTCENNL